ncbi:MAG TPA: fluoride efflux transporter CrcB [Feifaniaceae bacterium]|nr:fluoride efflux transporter CrcB [Feifaniaceae bacterium]
MLKALYAGLGGFIGCVLRYLVNLLAPKLLGAQFPYATLIVNTLGAFLIGLVMTLGENRISPEARIFLVTGILGGFTTFSAFSYETVSLFSAGNYGAGFLNVGLNVAFSLGGAALGIAAAKLLRS